MADHPSIFNDVMGPVMRGPSSSHCAAALRIGRICRALMNGEIENVTVKFDTNGSLATTHESQGSDMGFFGGLMGWAADDEQLLNYRSAAAESGVKIEISITDINAVHPNTYDIILQNRNETTTLTAVSTGGGMIKIIKLDGIEILIGGDYFETLVYSDTPERVTSFIQDNVKFEQLKICKGNTPIIQIKSRNELSQEILRQLNEIESVKLVKTIAPVLPILSSENSSVPFATCAQMLEYNKNKNLKLWELALHYECLRGKLTHDEVLNKMREIVSIMRNSIEAGLQGTEYKDRILGCQSKNFKQQMENNKLIGGDAINKIILFVTAIMEVKSSMGVIVAAPTAGSCGLLHGAVFGVASAMGLDEDEIVKSMFAASMIGIFIAVHSTFAAEEGGCMAECGSGSGMAAAAIVSLAGGTLAQSLSAASIALQNSFGMTCDPVANRVEAPCLGKNVMAASNALVCANMALADYNQLIPLDEVIEAMNEVAKSIPRQLKCTALGGLSVTKTSKEIESRLKN